MFTWAHRLWDWLWEKPAPRPTPEQIFGYLNPYPGAVIVGLEQYEVVYAKDQPQYVPLRALVSGEGAVISRWTLSLEQRQAVLMGADIFLELLTFGEPLQPIRVMVGTEEGFKQNRTYGS